METRAERRPQLSDLRGSGGLEQDADVVIFIYREGYYKAQEAEMESDLPEEVEIIIAKQRNGPTGTVKLLFMKNSTSFKSLSLRDEV